jgi:E3 ubiquitin-protein ligase HUWE1
VHFPELLDSSKTDTKSKATTSSDATASTPSVSSSSSSSSTSPAAAASPKSGSKRKSIDEGNTDDKSPSSTEKETTDEEFATIVEDAVKSLTSHVTLPGAQFRQNKEFKQMQGEIVSGPGGDRMLTFVERNRSLLNTMLRQNLSQNVSLLETSFRALIEVPTCRRYLHFDVKRNFFKKKMKRLRSEAGRMSGPLRLEVNREHVLEDSFHSFRGLNKDQLRQKLSVTFRSGGLEEEGMDAGGLTREWYTTLMRQIFDPNYGLFKTAGDGSTFQPNPQSNFVNEQDREFFKFFGQVVGKALVDGHLLDAHFTRSFYKHLLGLPVALQDLEGIDPDYFKNLLQLLKYPLDMLGLELTFTADEDKYGSLVSIPLFEKGSLVKVTDENKEAYVRLIAHHRMTTCIKRQIEAFLEGFHALVPPEYVSIFDAQELELFISGLPDIDLDDLRAHTDYQGYKASDTYINEFWRILKSFTDEEKALFLQFVTGTSKVPLDGFKALIGADGPKKFNISKESGALLPTAHTCFNQLVLPQFPTSEELRKKLLIAIKEGSEGFGFA